MAAIQDFRWKNAGTETLSICPTFLVRFTDHHSELCNFLSSLAFSRLFSSCHWPDKLEIFYFFLVVFIKISKVCLSPRLIVLPFLLPLKTASSVLILISSSWSGEEMKPVKSSHNYERLGKFDKSRRAQICIPEMFRSLLTRRKDEILHIPIRYADYCLRLNLFTSLNFDFINFFVYCVPKKKKKTSTRQSGISHLFCFISDRVSTLIINFYQ